MHNVSTPSCPEIAGTALEGRGESPEQPLRRKRERYIPAFDLTPGMVLAKPLMVAERGVVSFNLRAGETLSEPLIRQLLARRAEMVCIEAKDPRSEDERQAEIAQAEKRLEQIFQGAQPHSPTTRMLYELLLGYRRS